jgi:hypothetical protein
MMKYFTFLLGVAVLLASCNQNKKVSLQQYFAPVDSGVHSCGIKMIPIGQ